MNSKAKFHRFVSVILMLALLLPAVSPESVYAQSGDDFGRRVKTKAESDGIRRQANPGTGRVSFIGPESGRVLSAPRALGTFLRPQDPAMALAKRFGPEFGLRNPGRDLFEMRTVRSDDGRLTIRYQQKHDGIPVMGGELIVNTNDRGDLYSMSGEVSPDLALATRPTVDSSQSAETALQEVAIWYQKETADFVASEPELWIFDESLLRPSTRPVELVWRMEVTAKDGDLPVRELVLINAEWGGVSLHFNQIDTAWTGPGLWL